LSPSFPSSALQGGDKRIDSIANTIVRSDGNYSLYERPIRAYIARPAGAEGEE